MTQSNFYREIGLGRLLMAGLPGTEIDEGTLGLIRDFGVSKFIMFSRNAREGACRFRKLCRSIKQACIEAHLRPLLAIDQEGGPVRRLTPPEFMDMPSQDQVRKDSDPRIEMTKLAEATTRILKGCSIDMNLAPVLDLCLNASKNVLRHRCFGEDPETVSVLGSIYIKHLLRHRIMTCAKHFPGIGRVERDPHRHLPVVTADRAKVAVEMSPFICAIRSGTTCIMTSHVIFSALDPENPATFSSCIANSLLREKLGFKGVLLTDDLEMKGAVKKMGTEQAALSALMAGHDLLLVCSSQELVRRCLFYLAEALEKGVLPLERVKEAQKRLSLIEKGPGP